MSLRKMDPLPCSNVDRKGLKLLNGSEVPEFDCRQD